MSNKEIFVVETERASGEFVPDVFALTLEKAERKAGNMRLNGSITKVVRYVRTD